LMAMHRLRRLPVTDSEGRLVGLLSLADLVRHAKAASPVAASPLLGTLAAIVAPAPGTHQVQ